MEPSELDQISNEIQGIHKAMKNITEIVFATSPLLALSPSGWSWKNFNCCYLLRVSGLLIVFVRILTIIKVFVALGNDRPAILVKVEDTVLEAVIAISEGKSSDSVLDTLYSQVKLLMEDLKNDNNAMNWFNLLTPSFSALPTPPASVFHSASVFPSTIPSPPSSVFPSTIPTPPSSVFPSTLPSPPTSVFPSTPQFGSSKASHVGNKSPSSLEEKADEERHVMVGVEPNQPMSGVIGEEEGDALKIDGLEEEGDNGHQMDGVLSTEVLSGLEEKGDEDERMVGVESKEAASGSEEVDNGASALEEHENLPMVAVDSNTASSDMMQVDGESQPPSEAGPIKGIEASGLSQKPLTVGQIPVKPTRTEVENFRKSIEAKGTSLSIGRIEANAGRIVVQKKQRSIPECPSDTESDSPIDVEIPLEVRRSDRLANPKNIANLKIATSHSRKSSSGKRKSALKKDDLPEIVIQVSIPVNSS